MPAYQVSLATTTIYTALSYTWDSEPTDRVLNVHGKILMVKPNLDAALREFPSHPLPPITRNRPFLCYSTEPIYSEEVGFSARHAQVVVASEENPGLVQEHNPHKNHENAAELTVHEILAEPPDSTFLDPSECNLFWIDAICITKATSQR